MSELDSEDDYGSDLSSMSGSSSHSPSSSSSSSSSLPFRLSSSPGREPPANATDSPPRPVRARRSPTPPTYANFQADEARQQARRAARRREARERSDTLPQRLRRPSRVIVISSDEEDADDDVVFMGQSERRPEPPIPRLPRLGAGPAGSRARRAAGVDQAEYRRELDAIDATLQQREAETQALLGADLNDQRREILSPPPNPRPRIGLGGAVLRTGNRQINYDAQRRRRRARVDSPDYNIPGQYPRRDAPPQVAPEEGRFIPREPHEPRYQLGGGWANAIQPLGRERNDAWAWTTAERIVATAERGPERGRAGIMRALAQAVEHAADARGLHPNREAIMNLAFGPGMAGPGPGRGGYQTTESILAEVSCPTWDAVDKGFTDNFDLESQAPIIIDGPDDGAQSSYFQCAACGDPLLLSAAYDGPKDKVCALRCGHLIDQKCLTILSTPSTPEDMLNVMTSKGIPVLGQELEPKRRKRSSGKKDERANIYVWQCPVKGCGRKHTSKRIDRKEEDELFGEEEEEVWEQTEDGGAIAVYM